MSRINYFSPYIKENKVSPLKSRGNVILLIVILAVVAYIVLQVQVYLLKNDIAENKKVIESLNTGKIVEVIDTKRHVPLLEKYYKLVSVLSNDLGEEDIINSSLLERIFVTVPKDLYFGGFNIEKSKWGIAGYTDNRKKIAEFEHNLKKSGIVEKIHLNNIELDKGQYYFGIEGTFSEEVVEHANQ
ncbi:MAG: PilN domain-containing protein [Clostridia bacterium]|nr:PilN domain-containing protein [Clostridia bacterium]MDD4049226.1 PilN domain-containing protein [Clostridia bacterium]